MEKNLGEIKAILKKYGQEHLLNHYDKLDKKHQQELLEQIEKINFELINSLYENGKRTPSLNYVAKFYYLFSIKIDELVFLTLNKDLLKK